MKCENCGATNPDNAKLCKKCRKTFKENKFKVYWKYILIGVFSAFILLTIVYSIKGSENAFFYGVTPSIILAGFISTILSYNKNVRAGYDFNQFLQGLISAIIVGTSVIVLLAFNDPVQGLVLLLLIPGYIFWGFIGSCIGALVNIVRDNQFKGTALIIIGIIIISSILGYLVFFNHLFGNNEENYYDDALTSQFYELGLASAIENQTNTMINIDSLANEKNTTLLKDVKVRYQRMENLTEISSLVSSMKSNSSSNLEKNYADTLEKYIKLKHQYYSEIEIAINYLLQFNPQEARKHVKKAQNLLKQVKIQLEILNNLANQNPDFQSRITKIEYETSDFVNSTTLNWMKPDFYNSNATY